MREVEILEDLGIKDLIKENKKVIMTIMLMEISMEQEKK